MGSSGSRRSQLEFRYDDTRLPLDEVPLEKINELKERIRINIELAGINQRSITEIDEDERKIIEKYINSDLKKWVGEQESFEID